MDVLLVLVVSLVAYQVFQPSSTFRQVRADIRRRKQSSRDLAERLAELHQLTQEEKEVLRAYVLHAVYERVHNRQDTAVRRLIDKGILRPVAGGPSDAEVSTFSVAAWTRSYLVSRPELLV
jgi:hypothetical protein